MHQPVRTIINLWRSRSLLTIIEVQQTLFRGNTTFTKTVELCMTWFGKPFLEASIGNVLRRLFTEKIAIEVDPVQSGKSTRVVERNVERLVYWCQELWNQIYSVCPKFVCPMIIETGSGKLRHLASVNDVQWKFDWKTPVPLAIHNPIRNDPVLGQAR